MVADSSFDKLQDQADISLSNANIPSSSDESNAP
jgi:hypothetical protein